MKKELLLPLIFFISTFSVFSQKDDEKFKEIVKVSTTAVENQQKTGTCWSFATTSFLESELLRKGKGNYDLSEMYFVRLAYVEKARMYLMYHGKTNFGQGGQAHDVINVVRKAGFVPESIYEGNVYDPGNHDHKDLEEELTKYLEKLNGSFNEKKALKWEEEFNEILDKYLGKMSEYINVKGQSYEPAGFADFLQIDADDYIEFTSYTHHPFYSDVVLEVPDNWSNDRYYNVPINELLAIIDNALENGYTVCWDGDTSDKGFRFKLGTAEIRGTIMPNQKNRQKTFLDRSTTDDHLMHIVGISEDDQGEKYYYTKNSWGADKNDFGGYMYMSKDYLKLKTIAIMVHKDAVPEHIMAKLKN